MNDDFEDFEAAFIANTPELDRCYRFGVPTYLKVLLWIVGGWIAFTIGLSVGIGYSVIVSGYYFAKLCFGE